MARRKKHLAVMQEHRERLRSLRIPSRDQLAAALVQAVLDGSIREGWANRAAAACVKELEARGFDREACKRKWRDMDERECEKRALHAAGGIKRAEEAF